MTGFIVGSLIALGVLAVLLGIILAVASKVFHVDVDPRVEHVENLLPGVNCGACGLAGCSAMAEHIVAGDASPAKCPVCAGGERAAIFKLMGLEHEETEPRIARMLCGGGTACKDKEDYRGVADCRAAVLIHGGSKACDYACVGLGSCVDACPFGALTMSGTLEIDTARCMGCGVCTRRCPQHALGLIRDASKPEPLPQLCAEMPEAMTTALAL